MKVATITPSRGTEREPFLLYAREQMDMQSLQPDSRYFIAYTPENEHADLTKRVKSGYELAKKEGCDWVIVWEDDDAYHRQHIETILTCSQFDFVGYQDTIYYNIKNRTYDTIRHAGRASLFCTAFRVSALEGYRWPADNTVFLDINLWSWARQKRKKIKMLSGNPNTGIKGHGFGKAGGKGHRMTMRRKDDDLSFLRSRVDDKGFQFYTELMKKL